MNAHWVRNNTARAELGCRRTRNPGLASNPPCTDSLHRHPPQTDSRAGARALTDLEPTSARTKHESRSKMPVRKDAAKRNGDTLPMNAHCEIRFVPHDTAALTPPIFDVPPRYHARMTMFRHFAELWRVDQTPSRHSQPRALCSCTRQAARRRPVARCGLLDALFLRRRRPERRRDPFRYGQLGREGWEVKPVVLCRPRTGIS